MIELTRKFRNELYNFENIYCLISGGWHSTAAALLLYGLRLKNVTLVHNSTGLEMDYNRETMNDLIDLTGWEYIETKPILPGNKTVMDILVQSMRKVPEVMEDVKNGYYDRTKFKCCHYLKKKPAKTLYRSINKKNSVIVSGIAPYESMNRGIRLSELRNKDTYIRHHKKFGGVYHIYPFRDNYKPQEFKTFLIEKGWPNTKHSGCKICPILIVFDIFDKENNSRYRLSRNLLKKYTKMPLQTFIDEFV